MSVNYTKINTNTPQINLYSNQGLILRQLNYYRREAEETAKLQIQLHRYDNNGQLKCSIDPRLSISYLTTPASVSPNQQQQNSLSGSVLKSQNVDAGMRVVIPDCQGQSLWYWDSGENERRWEYDRLRRVKKIYEKSSSHAEICSEKLRYGDVQQDVKINNSIGFLIEHYDMAGCRLISRYSLQGQPKEETRFFLKSDEVIDWTEENQKNQRRLESNEYISRWAYNALGEVIQQSDAATNERKTHYGVDAQVSKKILRIKGKEQTLTEDRVYLANGQLQQENINDRQLQIQYQYELKTQRLSQKIMRRLRDNTVLQHVAYGYDPIGNILFINDQTQALAHYKNAKTNGISRYAYDSFYQLIEANGIESELSGQPHSTLPSPILLDNNDASRLVNYQRKFQYDDGGNLLKISHQGANPFTLKLTIDTNSNRGIQQQRSAPDLQESFDGNGNLLYINTAQALTWDSRNQLKKTVQVERETFQDNESYVYDNQGNRVQKIRCYLAQNQLHTEQVCYLPGLELRTHWQTDLDQQNKKIIEELQLIQTDLGNVSVKALHWEIGKPETLENDEFYYSIQDHLGSNQLELNQKSEIVSVESYYPYGGTAIWSTKNNVEGHYKYRRYSGKERDHSGLYYFGCRYYLPCLGRWVNPDPSGTADGLNLFRMAHNNPITFYDDRGKKPKNFLSNFLKKKPKKWEKLDDAGKINRLVENTLAGDEAQQLIEQATLPVVEDSIRNTLTLDYEGYPKTGFTWAGYEYDAMKVNLRVKADLTRFTSARAHFEELFVSPPTLEYIPQSGEAIKAAAEWILGQSRSKVNNTDQLVELLNKYKNADLLDNATIKAIHSEVYQPAAGVKYRLHRTADDPLFMSSYLAKKLFADTLLKLKEKNLESYGDILFGVIVRSHPFGDSNGRTARIAYALSQLQRADQPFRALTKESEHKLTGILQKES